MNQEQMTQDVANLVTRLKADYGLEVKNAMEASKASKYVIYARKSTDQSEKQERSIKDQIGACKDLVITANLGFVPVIHEEKSAKTSENRPKFRAMLNDIIKGVYDGIVTWSPDRLARNMKEAGEIIDLLDRGVIKDIRFANGHSFKNDSSGKMLLGIAFVMAKQYSDQHSTNIKRAVTRITAEGKLFDRAKHGYYKDRNGFPRPDGENWDLLEKAFKMRLDSKLSLEEIAEWLEDQGFPRKTKYKKYKSIKVNKNLLSDVFRDPFYAGALWHGDQIVNLLDKFDFQPMITPQELDRLIKINGVNKRFSLAEAMRRADTISADLLRGMVTCGGCNKKMYTAITTKRASDGKIDRYFYFRCLTNGCLRRPRSIRAHVLKNAMIEFLESNQLDYQKSYAEYLKRKKKQNENKSELFNKEIVSLSQQIRHLRDDINAVKKVIDEEKDLVIKREYRAQLKEGLKREIKLKAVLESLRVEKEKGERTFRTFEEFCELYKKLPSYIRKINTMKGLDAMAKKLFTNFLIEGEKVTKITQNSPLGELYDADASAMVDPIGFEPMTSALQRQRSTN